MNPAKIAARKIAIQTYIREDIGGGETVTIIEFAYAPFIQTVREFMQIVDALEPDDADLGATLDVFERLEEFLKEME